MLFLVTHYLLDFQGNGGWLTFATKPRHKGCILAVVTNSYHGVSQHTPHTDKAVCL